MVTSNRALGNHVWRFVSVVWLCVCAGVGGHRDVLDCVISSSCFPQTLPRPLLPPPTPSLHNETNTKEQEVPPVNWGPIKAIIIPVSEFLQEIASQKICQLCRECGIIVSEVSSVFFFFIYQSPRTKGHIERSPPRAGRTVTWWLLCTLLSLLLLPSLSLEIVSKTTDLSLKSTPVFCVFLFFFYWGCICKGSPQITA